MTITKHGQSTQGFFNTSLKNLHILKYLPFHQIRHVLILLWVVSEIINGLVLTRCASNNTPLISGPASPSNEYHSPWCRRYFEGDIRPTERTRRLIIQTLVNFKNVIKTCVSSDPPCYRWRCTESKLNCLRIVASSLAHFNSPWASSSSEHQDQACKVAQLLGWPICGTACLMTLSRHSRGALKKSATPQPWGITLHLLLPQRLALSVLHRDLENHGTW